MKIKLTRVYVDDQEKALRFYTEVLGFTKKPDFSNGPYRWLTVASPDEPDGTELTVCPPASSLNPGAGAGHRRRDPGVLRLSGRMAREQESGDGRGLRARPRER